MSFLTSLFGFRRVFSSYDECPGIYYRFNGGEERGPARLDHVIQYAGINPMDVVEGRFADERLWRPRAYFDRLWEMIPPSAHTLKRLNDERIAIETSLTECRGRELLREAQNRKSATRMQLQQLKTYGIATEAVPTREDAKRRITAAKLAIRERDAAIAEETKRLTEAPQIAACHERLNQLTSQIASIAPGWTRQQFRDLESLAMYTDLVAEALEYASGFDSERLLGNPFYDPVTSNDYYLEASDIPDQEIRAFQGQLFVSYVKNEGERFDHIKLLRTNIPSVRISKM
jgi:hypothetical protein